MKIQIGPTSVYVFSSVTIFILSQTYSTLRPEKNSKQNLRM